MKVKILALILGVAFSGLAQAEDNQGNQNSQGNEGGCSTRYEEQPWLAWVRPRALSFGA